MFCEINHRINRKMDSLVNYESEDEPDTGFEHKAMEALIAPQKQGCSSKKRSDDTNYDTVGMDLSEDSNSIKDSEGCFDSLENHKEKKSELKNKNITEETERHASDHYREDKERNKPKERYKDYYKDERSRDGVDRRKEYRSRKEHRRDRDDYHRDRERERDYKNKAERNYSNEGSGFQKRYRRSASPKSRKDRKRHQSRSKSRERTVVKSSTDNAYKKRDYEHKAITQSSSSSFITTKDTKSAGQEGKPATSVTLPNYYNPNVINPNKYAEQVQKRKLLWSNKKGDDAASKWEQAKFAQDADGKVASKFMRLMGIKSAPKANDLETTVSTNSNESIKKREEMFSSMEQQYEVARQVTHTMRGVGLGFSSQSRQF